MVTVSTIIPTHDRADLLMKRAIPSVLAQTVTDWECLVVGDDTDDATVRAMRRLCRRDPRFRFWNLPRQEYPGDARGRWQVGGTAAFNFGLDQAVGEWVSYLADDDCYRPTHHEALLAKAANADVVYGRSAGLVGFYGGVWPPEPYDIAQGAWIARRSIVGRATTVPGRAGWDADWWTELIGRGVRFKQVGHVVHEYHPAPENAIHHGGTPW